MSRTAMGEFWGLKPSSQNILEGSGAGIGMADSEDGCSGCEQRCADQFADVDDILEEYCDDCYSVPTSPSTCDKSGCLG